VHALLSSERTEVTVPLTDGDCLLIKPGLADAALDVPQVSVAELEMASLRTYGWAQTHVLGKSQERCRPCAWPRGAIRRA
jgi:hypothetical protein